MIRTLALFATLFVSAPIAKWAGTTPATKPVAPAVIGADHPVFLGRMTVVATPLPDVPRPRS